MKKIIFLLILIILPVTVNAARGCCSRHGGVSHCGPSGKYICNDGSPSPSCTCTYTYYDETPKPNNSITNNPPQKPQEEIKEPEVKEEEISKEEIIPPTQEEIEKIPEESEKYEENIQVEETPQVSNEKDIVDNTLVIEEKINNEEKTEDLTIGDMLTLAALATPGSIAAIVYEKNRKK